MSPHNDCPSGTPAYSGPKKNGQPVAPFEYHGEEKVHVDITEFSFDQLDDVRSYLKDVFRQSPSLDHFVDRVVHLMERGEKVSRDEVRLDMIQRLLALLLPSACIRVWALADAAGLAAMHGKSGPEIAESFHVKKQDFYQIRDRYIEELGLPRTAQMRSDSAKQKMRQRNFRK